MTGRKTLNSSKRGTLIKSSNAEQCDPFNSHVYNNSLRVSQNARKPFQNKNLEKDKKIYNDSKLGRQLSKSLSDLEMTSVRSRKEQEREAELFVQRQHLRDISVRNAIKNKLLKASKKDVNVVKHKRSSKAFSKYNDCIRGEERKNKVDSLFNLYGDEIEEPYNDYEPTMFHDDNIEEEMKIDDIPPLLKAQREYTARMVKHQDEEWAKLRESKIPDPINIDDNSLGFSLMYAIEMTSVAYIGISTNPTLMGKIATLYLAIQQLWGHKYSITANCPKLAVMVQQHGEFLNEFARDSSELLVMAFDEIAGTVGYVATGPKTLDTPLLCDCAKLIAELVASSFMVNLGFWSLDFHKWFKDAVFNFSSSKNIMTLIVSIFQQVVEGGRLFWKSGDFRDFFAISGGQQCYQDLVAIREEVRLAIAAQVQPLEVVALMERIGKLRKVLIDLSLALGIDHRHFHYVIKMINEVDDMYRDMGGVYSKGNIRRDPITFQVFGPPGVGKSSIMYALIHQSMSVAGVLPDGIDMNIAQIGHVNEADKFDSAISETTRAIVLDDAGALRPTATMGAAGIAKIINYSNSVPFITNQAELSKKGNTPCNHVCFAITSNTSHLYADGIFYVPEACLRRLKFYIEVKTNPDYLLNGQIDSEKLLKNNKKLMEVCDYRFYKRVMCNEKIKYVCLHDGYGRADGSTDTIINCVELMFLFNRHASLHWEQARKYQEEVKNLFISDMCGSCKVLKINGCCTCTYQGTGLDETSCSLYTRVVSYPSYIVKLIKHYIYSAITKYHLWKFGDEILSDIYYYNEAVRAIEDRSMLGMVIFQQNNCNLIRICGGIMLLLSSYTFYRLLFNKVNHYDATVKTKVGQNVIDVELPPPEKRAPYFYPINKSVEERVKLEIVESGIIDAKSTTTKTKLLTVISNNAVLIRVSGELVNGIFIRGNVLVTVAHVFPKEFHDKNSAVVLPIQLITKTVTTSVMHLERSNVAFVNGADMVFVRINVMNFKQDLTKFISSIRNMDNISLKSVNVYVLNKENDIVTNEVIHLENGIIARVPFASKGVDYGSNCFVFGFAMNTGSSGSVVFIENGTKVAIIGIQSAASKAGGTSAIQPFDLGGDDIDNFINNNIKEWFPTGMRFKDFNIPLLQKPGNYSIYPHLEGSAIIYKGTDPNHFGTRSSSNFRKTIMYDCFMIDGRPHINGEFISENKYIIPYLSSYSLRDEFGLRWVCPQLVGMADSSTTELIEPPESLVELCFQDYLSRLSKIKFANVDGPLTVGECLNGVPGIKGINKNAGAGFGYKGVIKDFLIYDTPERVRLKADIQEAYDLLEKQFFNGTDSPQVVKAHVKDEIIKESKQICPRIFMGSPFLFTILCKSYLMPIVNIILQHPFEFEVAVGINALGKSWGQIYNTMSQYKKVFDGDYRKYDKTQLRIVILFFVNLMVWIARKVHYPEYCIRMMIVLLYEMIYFTVNVGGDMFELLRSLGSGCLMTIFINCFVNSMYFRMAWFLNFNESFNIRNFLITYGDDCILATNELMFTFTYMQSSMKKFGIDMTPANKKLSNVDFVPISEITFLKRRFVPTILRDGETYVLCPLEEVSLVKMLCFTDVRKEDEDLILMRNIIDAHIQYWFFGKDIFLSRKCMLQRICFKVGYSNLLNSTSSTRFYSYDELEDKYISGDIQIQFV
jgi:hypothetical protein